MESWLGCNRRVIGLGTVVPLVFIGLGTYFIVHPWSDPSVVTWLYRSFGGLILFLGVATMAALLRAYRKPRIGYRQGNLLFFLRSGAPIPVPLNAVECFFRGQGPSHVGQGPVEQAETSNIVVRIAERATEWHRMDVKPALAHWCEGYITIHGAWCEPITATTLESLNSRLVKAKRGNGAESP